MDSKQHDLRLAREIQMSATPQVFPAYPGRTEFDIYAKMVPADEVGGDFYDFYFAGEERLAILIADVSDKGIPSALLMMRAKTLLKSLIESGRGPSEVLEEANNSLCQGNEMGMLLSAWLGIVDLKKGLVAYASAGHKPPILLKEFGEPQRLSGSKNCMLGAMEGMQYQESQAPLENNDQIFMWTDGITSSQNPDGQAFGEDRLLELLEIIRRHIRPEYFD